MRHDDAKTFKEKKRLRRTGNSTGVTLTRGALDAAGFSEDEAVTVTATRGKVVITPEGGAYDRTVEAGRAALEQYRYAFEKLGE